MLASSTVNLFSLCWHGQEIMVFGRIAMCVSFGKKLYGRIDLCVGMGKKEIRDEGCGVGPIPGPQTMTL